MDDEVKNYPNSERPPPLKKGTILSKYISITCLSIMWKILTAQIIKETYYSLIYRGLFPEKQKKRCCWVTKGTNNQLYIGLHILKETKTRRIYKAMARTDFRKAYNMVLQTWIKKCLKMNKISGKIINLISNATKNLRIELTTGGQSLVEL